jgi:hypothetical protein
MKFIFACERPVSHSANDHNEWPPAREGSEGGCFVLSIVVIVLPDLLALVMKQCMANFERVTAAGPLESTPIG